MQEPANWRIKSGFEELLILGHGPNTSQLWLACQSEMYLFSILKVIPKSRVFTSGTRDLACSIDAPREIPFDSLPFGQSLRAGSSLRLKSGLAQDDAAIIDSN